MKYCLGGKACANGPVVNGLSDYCCRQVVTFCRFVAKTVVDINTLRPRQNRRHIADDIFKCIFLNENAWISLKISLKFVPKVPINNIPSLVQIMAWRRPGDKPLSEPIMVNLSTPICVTRPHWVNTSRPHEMTDFGNDIFEYNVSNENYCFWLAISCIGLFPDNLISITILNNCKWHIFEEYLNTVQRLFI